MSKATDRDKAINKKKAAQLHYQANKEKINSQAAWEMLKSASLIRTGKGKKRQEWNPAADDKVEILKDVIGPSGNLRAPSWKIGNEFVVGFNPELYAEVFG